jgi:broad specificity phosphatase PhoE
MSEFLLEEFQNKKIEFLYSSTMKRALVSAEILSEKLNTPVVPVPGLEESDFGIWEGLSFEDLAVEFPEEFKQWIGDPLINKPPGGETLLDLKERVLQSAPDFLSLLNDEREWNIFIVSHRGPLSVLLLNYLNLGLDNFWNYKIDRGSISKLNLYPRFSELEYLNRKF